MIQFRFNSTYEFSEYEVGDQIDMGNELVSLLDTFFDLYNIKAEAVDMFCEGYAVSILGAKNALEYRSLLEIFNVAVEQVREGTI